MFAGAERGGGNSERESSTLEEALQTWGDNYPPRGANQPPMGDNQPPRAQDQLLLRDPALQRLLERGVATERGDSQLALQRLLETLPAAPPPRAARPAVRPPKPKPKPKPKPNPNPNPNPKTKTTRRSARPCLRRVWPRRRRRRRRRA